MNRALLIDQGAGSGHRPCAAPLGRECASARKEFGRETRVGGVVKAQGIDRQGLQTLLTGSQADIRAIKMET